MASLCHNELIAQCLYVWLYQSYISLITKPPRRFRVVYVGQPSYLGFQLTHWGRVTHICDSKLTTLGSDNGLSPGRRQTIMWTSAGILLIGPLRTNFSEIVVIEIHTFQGNTFENVWKMAAILSRPQCVNSFWHSDGTWRQVPCTALFQANGLSGVSTLTSRCLN